MRLILLAFSLVAVAASGSASHREHCTPSTSAPEVDAAGYYVDNDQGSDPWSIWVYQESNGQPGLQRRDEVADDTCGHPELGDTIIF